MKASYQYQFSDEIQRGWRWPERYSEGRVIQQYLAYVADTLHLRQDIIFDTRVEAANYDEAVQRSLDHPHLEYGGTIEVRELMQM